MAKTVSGPYHPHIIGDLTDRWQFRMMVLYTELVKSLLRLLRISISQNAHQISANW